MLYSPHPVVLVELVGFEAIAVLNEDENTDMGFSGGYNCSALLAEKTILAIRSR